MDQKSFIFIGRSGCGKGTQVKLLMDYLKEKDPEKDILYIYTGAEFREFIKGDSDTQKLAMDILEKGGLQPEFLSVYMWTNILVKSYTKKEHLIFDGTPRKRHEAGVLDSIFGFYGLSTPFVINLDVSEEWAIERLTERGRKDDNKDDITQRLSWYTTDVVPAINFYIDNPAYKFIKIDGERSIEDVHKDLVKAINIG